MSTVNQMDLDALTVVRRGEWDRMDALSRQRTLNGIEADEFIARYRSASADLADMKTSVGRSPHTDYLSTILARARLQFTGAPENVLRRVARFFVLQLPAALYRIRWLTLVIAVVWIAAAAVVAIWIAGDPKLVASLGDKAMLQKHAEEDFVNYYSENDSTIFAATVWTNNAFIAAQCVAFGITGIWPVYVLIQNAVSLGIAAAMLLEFDRGDVFLLHILPHGLLELTCIFAAAAAGLRLFWAVVAPGVRTRTAALATQARALVTVAIGLIFALALAGLVEGFVTAAPWPWPVKIGIGAAALAVFLIYMLIVGRRAWRQDETGDLTEYEAGTPTLVSG